MTETYTEIYIDGAAPGNPGDIRIAISIPALNYNATPNTLFFGTNNEAEYLALLYALDVIKRTPKLREQQLIRIYSDSAVVVEQVNGRWKCKPEHLQKLREQAFRAIAEIPGRILISWVPREQNIAGMLLE